MIYLFREGFFHLLFLFYWSLWEPIVFWHFWGLLAGQVQQKPCVLLYWAGRSVTRKALDFWNRSAGCLVFFHYCLFLLDFFFLLQFFNFNFQENSFLLLLSLILFWFYGCNILSLPLGVSFKCLLVVTVLVGYIPFFNFGAFAQVYGTSGRDIHSECNLIGSSLHAEKIHSRSEIAGKGYGHLYFIGCYSPWPSRQL